MLQNLFRNMQPVVKNLLIINALFFLATIIFEGKGISLTKELGLYYIGSSDFKPFQLATHFFMHAGFRHILFNMFALVIFGNMLERIWGGKKFLLFYFFTAFGAAFLHQFILGLELYNSTGTFFPDLDDHFTGHGDFIRYSTSHAAFLKSWINMHIPTVGASGAIYGLLAGAAVYFPNTKLYLYFAIPVKIKWLALGLVLFDIVSVIQDRPGDSVAHFAHIGGMLFGFVLVKIWQKDNTNFY